MVFYYSSYYSTSLRVLVSSSQSTVGRMEKGGIFSSVMSQWLSNRGGIDRPKRYSVAPMESSNKVDQCSNLKERLESINQVAFKLPRVNAMLRKNVVRRRKSTTSFASVVVNVKKEIDSDAPALSRGDFSANEVC